MKCYYNCCQSEEQKPHVVKHGVRNGIQRYRCLNCKRTFIQPNDRKNIGLKDYEKYIIEKLVNESVSYRAIVRVLNRSLSTIQKHVYSKKN